MKPTYNKKLIEGRIDQKTRAKFLKYSEKNRQYLLII
jgi:hypothetical protein